VKTLNIFASLFAAASCLGAEMEGEFHNTFEFKYRIPEAFKSYSTSSGNEDTPGGKIPYSEDFWVNGKESIMVKVLALPENAWKSSPDQMFSKAKEEMIKDAGMTLVSERDYKIGECHAHSFIFEVGGAQPGFARVDYILTKPDLNVVLYTTPSKDALDKPICKDFFDSISVRAKAVAE
jgi:hypothetical protein